MCELNFDFENNFDPPVPPLSDRKMAVKQSGLSQARKLLAKKEGVKKGQTWDFVIATEETQNGKIINNYTQRVSLTV